MMMPIEQHLLQMYEIDKDLRILNDDIMESIERRIKEVFIS
jgi:abortive infection bacteriophage resistance protein